MLRLCFSASVIAFLLTHGIQAYGQSRFHQVWTEKSPIEMVQTNYGITGFDPKKLISGTFWPRGSGQQYVFGMGLWVGGNIRIENATEERARVFVTYNPSSGASWGNPTDSAIIEVDGIRETITTKFNDGDLSQYEGGVEKRKAQGFPIGLEFAQTLVAWSEGPFRDVVLLRTHIRSTRSDTIWGMRLAYVLDFDIGHSSDGQFASLNDAVLPILTRPDLRILKFYNDPSDKNAPKGMVGVGLIQPPGDPDRVERTFTLILVPIENNSRYDAMSSVNVGTEQGDISALVGTGHISRLNPGDTIGVTIALVFVQRDDADADNKIINVIDQLTSTTSVNGTNYASRVAPCYPNPTNGASSLWIGDAHYERTIECVDILGRSHLKQLTSSSSIDVRGLAPGYYRVITQGQGALHSQMLCVTR